ncbi:unnamed protein product, partial [Onchocerca flexuosa]|uniref:Serine/threonine-protein kinase DDB_G0282963 n=1 Tax=Onchocerca flexuosa TaxID=387005 RepID=A0A183HRW5_9BILA
FNLNFFSKFQYLKVTPKLEINNGPSSSTINCNTLTISSSSSEIGTDQIPSTFQIVSSFNNCNDEFAVSVTSSSDDSSARMEVKPKESLSEMVEISSNDSSNQTMRLDTIDETIEAVIANGNGNENSTNEIGRNNYNNNNNNNNNNISR